MRVNFLSKIKIGKLTLEILFLIKTRGALKITIAKMPFKKGKNFGLSHPCLSYVIFLK